MFKKAQLKKQIAYYKELISEIENKRYRSQAALVEAILKSSEPGDQDVEFFNKFTEEIDAAREKLHALQQELEILEKK